jgi:hypothetical protein
MWRETLFAIPAEHENVSAFALSNCAMKNLMAYFKKQNRRIRLMDGYMSVAKNKVFYNRVRRACMKYGIEIKFTGTHRNYQAVQLLKDDQLLVGDYQQGRLSLTVNWKRIYDEITRYGFKCRDRKSGVQA